MPVTRIADEFSDFEIDGEVVAGPVSTRGRSGPRWFEATLYRKADGSYVLHVVNYSVVWHLDEHADSHVNRPEDTPRSQLPPGAVYCGSLSARPGRPQCPPAGRGGPPGAGPVVVTELPQHKMSRHPDVPALVREMMTARRPDGSVSVALSGPMRDLLIQAERNDPAFEGATRVTISM